MTDTNGYRRLNLVGKLHLLHRLAWLYMTGRWPDHAIDHINGARADNRWVNLREATWAQNNQHKVNFKRLPKSGLTGVYANGSRWSAQICAEGRRVWLGLHDTPEQAQAAYLAAKAELHPFSVAA